MLAHHQLALRGKEQSIGSENPFGEGWRVSGVPGRFQKDTVAIVGGPAVDFVAVHIREQQLVVGVVPNGAFGDLESFAQHLVRHRLGKARRL